MATSTSKRRTLGPSQDMSIHSLLLQKHRVLHADIPACEQAAG